MANKKPSRSARTSRRAKAAGPKPLFERRNYLIMTVGALLLIIGYSIMRIENQHLGFVSLYISPILILTGYGLFGYAILLRPKSGKADVETSAPA